MSKISDNNTVNSIGQAMGHTDQTAQRNPPGDWASSQGGKDGTVTLGSRLIAIARRRRDRYLSDPSLMERAGRSVVGRMIARREARTLFDVTAGFVYSQVLVALVRLDVLPRLLAEPMTTEQLAAALDLPGRSVHRLMVAGEALGLVERRGPNWGLGRRGAAVTGNPGLIAMVHHHDLLYRDLSDPVDLLRRGYGEALPAFWPYATASGLGEGAAGYSALMGVSQHFLANEVLSAYPFGRHRHLLDVAGGEGVFVAQALNRHPQLTASVFDLPPVAARARQRLADEGLSDRATAVPGDIFTDRLPEADVVTLVRVIHDHEDDEARTIVSKVFDALPTGGCLVLAEPMAGAAAAPGIGAYFAMYLFAMGSGRPRTAGELRSMLKGAGFRRVRLRRDRNPIVTRVITAVR